MGEETDPGGDGDSEDGDVEWPHDVDTAIGRAVSTEGPATDLVFGSLSKRYRRFVLYCLSHRGGAMDVEGLTDAVVSLAESSDFSSPTRRSVTARLNHTTLPYLADAGFVIHDREAGVVWPTEAVDALEPLLDLGAALDFESEPPLAGNCAE